MAFLQSLTATNYHSQILSLVLRIFLFLRIYGLVSVVAAVLIRGIYNRYSSPLRKYPGPFIGSCTRAWQVWIAWSGRGEAIYMDVHRKYGPVVRIGPDEISFASPFAALDLFKTGKGFHKTEFYTVFLPDGRKDIFTEIREPVHAVMKRFATPAYSLAAIQQHTSEVEVVMRKFVEKMDNFAAPEHQRPCLLGDWLHYLAFDTLGQFAFAKTFGFLEAGNDMDGAITSISKSTYESSIIGQAPFLDHLTRRNPLVNYVPFVPPNKATVFFDTAFSMLREYMDPNSDRRNQKSLMKALLDSHNQNPEKFTFDNVMAISMGAVAAGSDSTASTMQTFVWHVLANPAVHEKLVAELLSNKLSEIVEYREAQALPYFQACLKEAMRFQPAVGLNITRYTPVNGAEINGIWVPGKTKVAVNGWVLHRDKEVFGPDADIFNPERWLIKDDEHMRLMERCLIQFGGGSHVCIGRHLALFEMNKVLPLLFRLYDMKLVYPEKPLDHATGFFYIQSGLEVYLHRRVLP